MVLSGRSMPFKILTYSGRYVEEELEVGASLVRDSRGRMGNMGKTDNPFSIHHCCHSAPNSNRCFGPGYRAKRLAGPSDPWSRLYSTRWETPESYCQLRYYVLRRVC
jgi:hypothetical protein